MYDAHRQLIVVGMASYNQYYTPPVLNVYKQKNPLRVNKYPIRLWARRMCNNMCTYRRT